VQGKSSNISPSGFLWPTLAIGIYVLLFVPIVLFTAQTLNQNAQQRTLNSDIDVVADEVSRHVGEIQSLMTSLASMHQVGNSERVDALAGFSEQLRSRIPMITAIGRFRTLAYDERYSFESDMREKGLYNYQITDLLGDGTKKPSPLRLMYMPVSSIEPMHPTLIGLLGTDLAVNKDLVKELNNMTIENRESMVRIQDGWPKSGQLMVLRPVYRGMHAPVEEKDRLEQADGGYWAILDTQLFSSILYSDLENYTTTFVIKNSLGTHTLASRESTQNDGSYMASWFKPRTARRYFQLGNSNLTLQLKIKSGVLPSMLIGTLALLALTSFCLYLLISYTLQKRRARIELERNRDILFAEREKASRTLDAIGDAIISINSEAMIQHVNPAAEELLADNSDHLIGTCLSKHLRLHKQSEPTESFNPALELANLTSEHRLDIDLTPADSPDSVLSTTLTRTGDDQTSGILVFRDTSAEAKLHQALEHQANHDALTGCTNRFYFEQQLQQLIESKRANDKKHALLFMDLDQFKIVNDTAGHSAGDRLLVKLSNELHKIKRGSDTLSRIGGDEFALLISDVDAAQALNVANKYFELFQKMVFSEDGNTFQVRCSFGLVHFDEAHGSMAEVMAAADMACYAAKDLGRNKLFVYQADDETISSKSSELNWLQRLKQALDEDLFQLRAQPLVTVNNLQIDHFEFLLRLVDRDGKETSPWSIINAAERYNMMQEVDHWVIKNAFKTISELPEKYDGIVFGINLSGQSATDPNLINFLKEQFKLHNIEPRRLCFEITETAAIEHFRIAVDLANDLRKLGCTMALDDFGSGLSSFGYLKNLPVDMLKIDGQFIRELASNPIDQAMVKAIRDVAVSMNLITVAEFVEDEETVAVLSEIGIDIAQGFHFGKPVPVDHALREADAHNARKQNLGRAA